MNPLIRVQNLGRTYRSDGTSVTVLKGINLTVNHGEMLAVMGPSGCGKSTLMHLVGLLDTPSSGEIYFGEDSVGCLNDNARAHLRATKIGFVFQSFNLLKRFSALENVLLPTIYVSQSHPLRGSSGRLKEKAERLLSGIGLSDRLRHLTGKLSGGEQQRVAIARALINDPEIVLADEPTGNLDSQSGAEVLNLLRDLNAEGRTIIVVTHDQSVASVCGRIVRMKDGMIVA